MRSSSPSAGKLSVREIALLPLMGALIFAAKEALYALPNININAVLIILCAVFFGWSTAFISGGSAISTPGRCCWPWPC